MTFEKIPTVETYRGVPIHDRQGPARIAFVRRQIDAVVDGDWTLDRLAAFAGDGRNAPEARLLAADVVQKYFENRRFERQAVPFDVDNLIATVAALDLRNGGARIASRR